MQNEIINKLKEGNKRFIEGKTLNKEVNPSSLSGGQSPHTIVVTCSDSRVPPELLFDKDLGELFVIRIAGNTASNEAIGSIEYAAANLGSSVCLVLGHTNCGAVGAAVDHVEKNSQMPSKGIQSLVDPIVCSVKKSIEKNTGDTLDCAIDLNVHQTISDLEEKSDILRNLKNDGKLKFIGGKYHLKSGEVEFF